MKQEELDKLLSHLADDREQAGAAYNLLRRKLVNLLRLLGHSAPEDAADRAFDITAAKLTAGEMINDVASYLKGVAKMLCKEDLRKQLREEKARRDATFFPPPAPPDGKHVLMKLCFTQLGADDRHFLLHYYAGADIDERARNRLRMAEQMQATLNTLRLRAHRLRQRLRSCLRTRRLG